MCVVVSRALASGRDRSSLDKETNVFVSLITPSCSILFLLKEGITRSLFAG